MLLSNKVRILIKAILEKLDDLYEEEEESSEETVSGMPNEYFRLSKWSV